MKKLVPLLIGAALILGGCAKDQKLWDNSGNENAPKSIWNTNGKTNPPEEFWNGGSNESAPRSFWKKSDGTDMLNQEAPEEEKKEDK